MNKQKINLYIFSITLLLFFTNSQTQSKNNNYNYQHLQEPYTIELAHSCFLNLAMPSCKQTIQSCLASQQCRQQLMFYQDCSFEKQNDNQIFNGNCFKNWLKTSIKTKQVIQCLNKHCKLAEYNNDVSLKVMYSCSHEVLMDKELYCEQECQEGLKKIVSTKVDSIPLAKLYSDTEIKNLLKSQNARNIVEAIFQECISENGTTKIKHEQNYLQKKRNQFGLDRELRKSAEKKQQTEEL